MRVAYRFIQWAFPNAYKVKAWVKRNKPEDKVEWVLISALAVCVILEIGCIIAIGMIDVS